MIKQNNRIFDIINYGGTGRKNILFLESVTEENNSSEFSIPTRHFERYFINFLCHFQKYEWLN